MSDNPEQLQTPSPSLGQAFAMLWHATLGLFVPIAVMLAITMGGFWLMVQFGQEAWQASAAEYEARGGDYVLPPQDMPEDFPLTLGQVMALASIWWIPVVWSLAIIPYSLAMVALQVQCLLRYHFGQPGRFADAWPYVSRRLWAVMGVGLVAMIGIGMWGQIGGGIAGLLQPLLPVNLGIIITVLITTILAAPAYAVLGTTQAVLLLEGKSVPDALQIAWSRGIENMRHNAITYAIVMLITSLPPGLMTMGWVIEMQNKSLELGEEEFLSWLLQTDFVDQFTIPFMLYFPSGIAIMLTGAVLWHQTRPRPVQSQ
ncbi:MAG: hypothetical protein Alpg2KO_32310 [Alphaproteobacteria bacterium]